jgi:alanyl-tRNA synthetase
VFFDRILNRKEAVTEMTKKIYEIDVYRRRLTTKIKERVEENGRYFILLEETIFFPEGGGQPCDLGTIDGIELLDVQERGDEIYHEVKTFPENDQVTCLLDWSRRLDSMQQHCGEHILSGVIHKLYGGINKGFHMGKEMVTIDIDLKSLSGDQLIKIEEESNAVIYRNAEITTQVVHSTEEAAAYPLRKQMTVDSDIRIVQIDDADCVACCGTHPNLAGEVGLIKIYKAEKNKGMTRLHFKCGARAMKDYEERHQVLSQIMQLYSADLNSVVDKIKNERDKAAQTREALRQFKMTVNNAWIDSHIESHKNIIEIFDDKDMEDLKYMTKKITDSDFAHTLCIASKQDYGLVLASTVVNCGQLFKDHIKTYNGRGGGSPKMAQGSFQNEGDMMKFLDALTVLI